MDLDYEAIGRNVRVGRLKKRLKQAELAELVNVSTQYISHIECGKNKASLDVIVRLASVLSLNLYTMIGESDQSQWNYAFLAELNSIIKDLTVDQRVLCLELCRTVANCRDLEK